ncbi:MAG: outer membrane protein assembly factor BamA, partial [Rhizobiales bacterium]|nr:outer membrane protein assembly factor BamA [Hyphomicrobiales bacterium]
MRKNSNLKKINQKANNKAALVKILSTTSLVVGTLLMSQVALAANVQNLILSGNNNVSSETVFQNLELKKGQEITNESINASITSLHSTGLFKNVKVFSKGSTLYITVEENPIINSVRYVGNKNLSSGLLNSVTKLNARDYFTKGKINLAVSEIKKKYTSSRHPNVQVSYKVETLANGKADILFTITEGATTTVQKVSFVGNSIFSDGALRGVVSSKEASIWHILSGADSYNADKVTYDRELLRRHYLKHGYADFSVTSAVADLDEDSNKYFITFAVDEGEQYKFGEVDVDSAFANLPPEDLLGLVKGRGGDVYNAAQLNDTIEAIGKEASRRGYSFAKVTPIITRNAVEKTIDVVYAVEVGERVYVERINIIGNVRTHDEVIRREFTIAEGDALNVQAMERAKLRLQKTGFFTGIRISTAPGSSKDRVILNVEVTENATGEIGAQAAYSTLSGLVGSLSFKESNLLGTGQQLAASLSWAEKEKSANFSFTEPKFMGSDYAVGASIFASYGDDSDSKRHFKVGTGLNIGLPIGEFTTMRARYNFTFDNNRTDSTKDYISAAGVNVTYDTRNKVVMPTEGIKLEADLEFAGLGGNVKYIRAIGKAEGHYEVVEDIILSAYLQAGAIKSIAGTPLRQQDTFYKGGDLVRGFAADGIGPRKLIGGNIDATGGTIYAGATAEIVIPVIKSVGIYAGLFADAGTLYKSSVAGSLANARQIRSSVGASEIWHSPIGPLRADYAYVLNKNSND